MKFQDVFNLRSIKGSTRKVKMSVKRKWRRSISEVRGEVWGKKKGSNGEVKGSKGK